MTSTKRKNLIRLTLFAVFAVMFLTAVFFVTANAKTAYALGDGEIEYEFDPVPAMSIELSVPGGVTAMKPGRTLDLGQTVMPWYTTATIRYRLSNESLPWVSINETTGELSLTYEAQSHIGKSFSVIVSADNGAGNMVESQAYSFTVEKIALNSFAIGANRTAIQQGGYSMVSVASANPADATELQGGVRYYIKDDTYATIDEYTGEIRATDNLPNSDIPITVYAECDGQRSNDLPLTLFIPDFTLSANGSAGTIEVSEGSTVTLNIHYDTNSVMLGGDISYEIVNVNGASFVVGGAITSTTLTATFTIGSNITTAGASVRVQAVCDGITTNTVEIKIYLPVRNLQFNDSAPANGGYVEQAASGNTYNFAASPVESCATNKNNAITYALKNSSGTNLDTAIATISTSGILMVYENYSAIGLAIRVVATWDDSAKGLTVTADRAVTIKRVIASGITLSVKKGTVEVGNATANSVLPRPGDALSISVGYSPANTSLKSYTVAISDISGISLASSSFTKSAASVTVPALSYMTSNTPSFKVTATYTDGGTTRTASAMVKVYVPVNTLDIKQGTTILSTSSGSPISLDRNTSYTITPRYNGTSDIATEKGGTFVSNSTQLTITNNNTLFIAKSATAGTVLSFKFTSSTDATKSVTCYVKVAPLAGKFTVDYYNKNTSTYGSAGTDSGGRELKMSAPQLETGYSLQILPKYANEALSAYGLSYSVAATNATYSNGTITPTSGVSGKGTTIVYTVTVTDGDTVYTIKNQGASTVTRQIGSASATMISNSSTLPNTISIFKRRTGSASLNVSYVYSMATTLSVSSVSDSSATSDISALTIALKDNDAGKVSFKDNVFKVLSGSASKTQSLQISCVQTYNNTTINYTYDVYVYIKQITLNQVSGANGTTNIIAVDGLWKSITTPERSGYVFGGYYTSSSGGGTQYYNASGNQVTSFNSSTLTTLYAYWIKSYYKVTRTNDMANIDSSSREEIYSPEFNVEALKTAGYNHVTITVVYDIKSESGLSPGQRLQIASYGKTKELGRKNTSQGTSWGEDFVLTVTVSIDSLNSSSGQFMLLWSKTATAQVAVGTRIVTITAIP
jgi:hypothetical protein